MPATLVVFGDSVTWGQGLDDAHKLGTLVARALNTRFPGIRLELFAHSGATIGGRTVTMKAAVDGEVPVSFPTVLQQVRGYPGNAAEARVVILNGGINDVDIRVILNPLTDPDDLTDAVSEHCFEHMRTLLLQTARTFDDPAVPIVVTGYYPILSADSEPLRFRFMLEIFGVGLPFFIPHVAIVDKIVDLCTQFWRQSTAELQRAVDDCNRQLGVRRAVFATPTFTDAHAVFATDPWLFGLNGDFSAQDEVVEPRRDACELAIPPFDILYREQCFRASAGHPNVRGAAEYAAVVLAALGL